MAREFKTGYKVTGDSSGAVRAAQATRGELDKLNNTVEKQTKLGQLASGGIGKYAAGLAGAATVAAGAILGIGRFAKAIADQGDRVQKLSIQLGVSTEYLSGMAHAANLSGSSLEGLAKGQAKLSRSITDLGDGLSTQVMAFDRLGITYEDLKNLSPEQQFIKTAAAVGAMEDKAMRTATAMQIFGRSGVELIPLFAAGEEGMAAMRAEAERLGLVMSSDFADASAQFNDNMTRAEGVVTGIKRQVAEGLLPSLSALAEQFVDSAEATDTWENVGEFLGNLVRVLVAGFTILKETVVLVAEYIWAAGKSIVDTLQAITAPVTEFVASAGQALRALAVGDFEGAAAAFTGLGDRIAASFKENMGQVQATMKQFGVDAKERIVNAVDTVNDILTKNATISQGAAEGMEELTDQTDRSAKAADLAAKAYETLVDRLDPLAKLQKQFTVEQAILAGKIAEGGAGVAYYTQLLEILKEEYAAAARDAVGFGDKAAAAAEKAAERAAAAAQKEADARAAALAKQAEDMETFEKAFNRGVERMDDLGADLWKGWFTGAKDAMDSIKSFFQNWLAEMAHAAITRPILVQFQNALGGSSSGGGGWLSALGGLFGGGGTGNLGPNYGIPGGTSSSGGFNMVSGIASLFNAGKTALSWGAGLFGAGAASTASAAAASGTFASGNFAAAVPAWFTGGTAGASAAAGVGTLGPSYGIAGGATGAAGAAGGAGSFAAAIPVIGWIVAGVMANMSLYDAGWKAENIDSKGRTAAWLTGGGPTLVADKLLQAIGLNGKWAAMLSGSAIIAKLFGHKEPKVTDTGIRGEYGFGGVDGEEFANIKAKGGWFRSDKKWTETTALGDELSELLSDVVVDFSEWADHLAGMAGIELSDAIDKATFDFDITFDKDPAKAQQQIQELISEMGINLISVIADEFGEGVKAFTSAGDDINDQLARLTIAAKTIGLVNAEVGLAERSFSEFLAVATSMKGAGEDITTAFDRLLVDLVVIIGNLETIRGFASSNLVADFDAMIAQQGLTLKEVTSGIADQIRAMRENFTGSADDLAQLTSLSQQRYSSELAYLVQIEQVASGISTIFGGLKEQINRDLFGDEAFYNQITDQAEQLAADLKTMTDPAKIANTVAEIQRLTGIAYGLLDDTGKAANGQGFLDFIEGVEADAGASLQLARDLFIEESAVLRTLVEEMAESFGDPLAIAATAHEGAAAELLQAGQTLNSAAGEMVGAVREGLDSIRQEIALPAGGAPISTTNSTGGANNSTEQSATQQLLTVIAARLERVESAVLNAGGATVGAIYANGAPQVTVVNQGPSAVLR